MTITRIIRSRRRSVALIVTREAELIVRAPWQVSEGFIQNLILEKRDWVERKIQETRERLQKIAPKQFVEGEEFLFLSQKYSLKIVDEAREISLDGPSLVFPRAFLTSPREHLKAWYRQEALKVIASRVEFFAQRDGFQYKSVRISSAQRRWGSCGSRGGLNFSWRLVMLPMSVIDYLVVHELHHLRHRNHSSRYWDAVRAAMPSFEREEKLLRFYESHVVI
ncbi:MAG: M48 family metallopeptidase [Candidatus Omnitrophica bacterium]|nr:M48 family metallopeptidase [Candidatus Omnitrophota bacterium]